MEANEEENGVRSDNERSDALNTEHTQKVVSFKMVAVWDPNWRSCQTGYC